MTDRPIIFSGPMVQALLAGRKSQTRRVLKPQPTGPVVYHQTLTSGMCVGLEREPPYAPGDRLYVREAHALVPATAYRMSQGVVQAIDPEDMDRACVYREGWERSKPGTGWRPSIHMPRWASRLTLTVTEVRVQRLQEISEADAVAEGIEQARSGRFYDPTVSRGTAAHLGGMFYGPKPAYEVLWNSLHGPDAWDANPWVVAVGFTVEKRNIDAP